MGKKKFTLRRPKGRMKIFRSGPPAPWTELPRDLTANILRRLGAVEILNSAEKVCSTWRSVCKDPAMWRVIDMTNLGDLDSINLHKLEAMCRRAVDRSQGQLIEVNIEYFATDELLLYIAQRSNQLKCLRLSCCFPVSGQGLREAVKRFPQLEELHLIITPNFLDSHIEAIGYSCPLMRSFTFNLVPCKDPPIEGGQFALAVAKTMPNLRHLRLLGNSMTNEALQAIVDGCPHLESLDLRMCLNVDLGGDLEKRFSKQIKDLRRPHDSIADCKWIAGVYDSDEDYDDFLYEHGFGYFEDYEEYYEDYANPFSSEYFPHHPAWLFDTFDHEDF